MSGREWLTRRPIAHRGLHDEAAGIVENTLSAARAAIEAGFAIEVDVQPAADLEPVVFHDESLERLTTGYGAVGEHTVSELADIPFRRTGDRIPSLRQLLDTVAGRVPLLVEVKTDWSGMPGFCTRIAEILGGYAGPVAVMSFDPLAVAAFRDLAPNLPRGIVAESFRDWKPRGTTAAQRRNMRWLLHAGRTRPHFIAYGVDDLPALAPLTLRYLLGVPLLTWTVRREDQRRQAARWADQIIFEGFRP